MIQDILDQLNQISPIERLTVFSQYDQVTGRRPDEGQIWMREQAKKRPAEYYSLPAAVQWEVDKQLGILDWDGK